VNGLTERPPTVSIGLAVRNGREVVARCVESVLFQELSDLELVISDNASDDGTPELLEQYARADRRVRWSANPVNIGLHANVDRVLELSRGEFFRWISADDWLEPEYLRECVDALRSNEDAIGVTTYFTVHTDDGRSRYEEYQGDFPTSADPAERFERMLWFFHAGDAKYDPMYGTYRRDPLARADRRRAASEHSDWLLSTRLALMGPIVHVPKRLAHRARSYPRRIDRAAHRRRLDPVRGEELKSSARRLHDDLLSLVLEANLSEEQVRRCKRALRRFWAKDIASRSRSRMSAMREGVVAR
jgi:glycosyltransferase involved in cell wall biosynthesis